MKWDRFPNATLGYCTNVHPGATLDEIKRQLDTHAVAVRARVLPGAEAPMGVGLWFPASVAYELAGDLKDDRPARELREWLAERGLLPYTLNGFPYGDFHGETVKHDVYQPDWGTAERYNYTLALIWILDHLLPEGATGSISTLPLGREGQVYEGWSDMLLEIVDVLADLEADTGRYIHLGLEPEPGCEVGDASTLMMLLMSLRMGGDDPDKLRRYVRPCLDICHSAVMFERPTDMLAAVRASGYRVGKVQISSALRVPFRGKPAAHKKQLKAELQRFAEDRYLHQTTVGTKPGSKLKRFHDDLPEALSVRGPGSDEWRVHFHVPVHLETLGVLETTRHYIPELLSAITPEDGIEHFEVETYAWDVLPPEVWTDQTRPATLADGIADELEWVRSLGCGV